MKIMIQSLLMILMMLFSCKQTSVHPEDTTRIPVATIVLYYNTENQRFDLLTDYNINFFLSDCDVIYFLAVNKDQICSEDELNEIDKRENGVQPSNGNLIPQPEKMKL